MSTCDFASVDPPRPVVDVLSPGIASWLTRHKLTACKGISSLRDYVVVQQARRQVRIHRRAGNSWQTRLYTGARPVRLASVGLTLPMERIYRDVLRQGRA